MAIEEAKYTTLLKERSFEVRQYAPHIVAETVVDGDLKAPVIRRLVRCFNTSLATTGPAIKLP